MDRFTDTSRRVAYAAVGIITVLMLAGCGPDNRNGQWVDAGGEQGQGGLAFVILAAVVGLLFASLFYMDRIRKRRSGESED